MIGDYHLTVICLMGIWALVALGLNVIAGYSGQFNLGIGVYMGAAAYTTAMLTTNGLSFWWSLPLSLGAAGLLGLLAGLPSLRVREDSLVTLSIGLVFVFESLLLYLPYFGGPIGIARIPTPELFGEPMGRASYAVMVWLCVALACGLSWWLQKAWMGLAWESIREDETAASVVGLYSPRYKLYAFVIGAVLAGLGGVLYAHFINYVTPYDFGFIPSVYVLAMVVFGGLGTIRGALLGAVLLTALPEVFRFIQDYRNLLYGALLMLLMLYQPKGLIGDGSLLWNFCKGIGQRLPWRAQRASSPGSK